ncbi:MAG: hypothetical protein HUK15_08120, partial [Bacteroidales bacterium]|nr:hypothetical protein [Bacteroidales bacterium]
DTESDISWFEAGHNYYWNAPTCYSAYIVYKNINSDPYYVEITSLDDNSVNELFTLAGYAKDSLAVDAGARYQLKFTQKSGYSFYPSTRTCTIEADCGYHYTRQTPDNVKSTQPVEIDLPSEHKAVLVKE